MEEHEKGIRRVGTRCVHADGARRGGAPLALPIVRSSTFHLDDATYAQRRTGHTDRSTAYSRENNPTLQAVEEHLASLEGAERTLLFSSGMAAHHAALMAVLERGDNVVAFRQLYGGSLSLFADLFPRLGVELRLVDVNDLDALRERVDARTRVVSCESISNPLTAVADLPAISALVRELSDRVLLVVDATLASPIGQRPLELGADFVFHSATKYLGGHSDLIGGVLSGKEELVHAAWEWRTRAGGCMDPGGAYLLERGLKTLALRMRAHSDGALLVARFLEDHPAVERVHYCGLESHPHHELALRVLDLPGGLLSFVVRAGDDAALASLRRLRLIAEAPSLGGVESLANRPLDLSHVGLSAAERAAAGIAPGLIRLSIGIEDPLDLIEDLGRALGRA